MNKWLRWKIAVLLNRLPDTCWAELVMWAEFPENHEFMEVFSLRHSAGYCERMGDTPYCGKCGGGYTMSILQQFKDIVTAKSILQQFQDAVAVGGLGAGVDFARSLSESQQSLLISAIEAGGAGWVAAWLTLCLAEEG